MVIKFCGEISGKCKQYLLHRESKHGLIAGFITATIFSILAILLMISVHWVFVIFLPILIVMALLAGLPPNKNSYDLIMPSSVAIYFEKGILISQSNKFYHEQSIDEIKYIVDYGEWYHIFFFNRNGRFICQKKLICQGTLEDFEQLFDGKIVKRKKDTENAV